MTEDQISALMLEHANGRPLREILAEVYEDGHYAGQRAARCLDQ